jgi:mannose/cellobiose epimerase-like protein (N-acyl-D-glucosamine 2-epimerase family)
MSDDVFADAFALLAAAADVKAFEARITKLKKMSEQVAAAEAQLAADREQHSRTVVAADEQAKTVRDREAKVILAERKLIAGQEALAAERRAFAADRYPPDPNLFGTIRQEPYTNG